MYALWDETVTPITYYIEFDGNAGTAALKHSLIKWRCSTERKSFFRSRSRKGRDLLWDGNTRTDGQGTEYHPQDTVKNLTTVNHATVKLYARWKQRRIIAL